MKPAGLRMVDPANAHCFSSSIAALRHLGLFIFVHEARGAGLWSGAIGAFSHRVGSALPVTMAAAFGLSEAL